MGPLLQDVLVDIFNAAKTSRDYRQKLFELEQVREILLYRDKSLIARFHSDIFSFQSEKSVQLRKFLLKFACDMLDENFDLILPEMITLFRSFISDSSDGVLTMLAETVAKYYSKITLAISSMEASSHAATVDPRQLWDIFSRIVSTLDEFMSSAHSDTVKLAASKLVEEQILFGISNNAASNTAVALDPRLSRKMNDPRLARSNQADDAVGADKIPLHHPFLNRNNFQREGEDLYLKAKQWLSKGGSQSNPFSATMMSRLGQLIATVGTMRPNSYGVDAAQSLTVLINTKSAVVQDMTKVWRENLAKAVHRLLRAATIYSSDAEQQQHMQKLKDALNSLDITSGTNQSSAEDAKVSGSKRDLDALEGEVAEQSGLDKPDRGDILAAIERKEQIRRSVANNNLDEIIDGFGEDFKVSEGELTEFAVADSISALKLSLGSKAKLVHVDSHSTDVSPKANVLKDGEEYKELALLMVLKLLENYVIMLERGEKVLIIHTIDGI
jgi:hypothetical protein